MPSGQRGNADRPDGDRPVGPGSGSASEPTTRRGGRPSLGPRKGFPLRLSAELMDQLRGWAIQDMRSLNAQIEFLLREALRRRAGTRSKN